LMSQAISSTDFDPARISGPTYFIVQRGRTYFENREKVAFIRANYPRVHEVQVNGMTACEVFVGPKETR